MAELTQKKFLDQAGVTTLWSRITTKLGDESATLKALIDANTAAIGAEEARALAAEKANSDAIAGLQAIVNSILENEDDINLNSIAELAAWITAHGADAEALTSAIEALEAKTVLGTDAEGNEYATVKAYVEAAIAAVTSGDVADLKTRVAAIEAVYETKTGAQEKANAAEANAKAYADGLAGNYDAAGSAAAAEAAAKAYADDLAGNYDAAGSADDALEAAKAYTDELANGQVTTNKNDIADIIAAMPIALSTEEIDAAIADAKAPAVSE